MREQQSILFVTSRNILTTSGELRLIKNRAEALYKQFNIPTDFLVWQSESRINSTKRESIQAGGALYTVPFSVTGILKSFSHLKKKLAELLQNKHYTAIVLSGFAMAALTAYIQHRFKGKLCVDIHGASEDVIELTRGGSIASRVRSRMIFYTDYLLLKHNVKKSDYCFVVTNELRMYVQKRFHTTEHTKFIVAPCATDSSSFDIQAYQINRERYRAKYGINEEIPVFVYSGGVSRWQCIKETVQLYEKLASRIPQAKMLIFSHHVDYIQKLTDHPGIIFDSYTPDELEKALCAADFAFLLRQDCVTNNVAFPNKYLEYVKSGLKVITTPYLREIAGQVSQYGMGFLFDMEGDVEQLVDYIRQTPKNVDANALDKVLALNSFARTLNELKDGF